MLPLFHTLRFGRFQYVSLLVILACLVIYTVQMESERRVDLAIKQYCENHYQPEQASEPLARIWPGQESCKSTLGLFSYVGNAEKLIRHRREYFSNYWIPSYSKYDGTLNAVLEQVALYQETAPINVTRWLKYYPDFPNPLQMITASLAHASPSHLLFNLLFFFAFAMMVEPAIHNWRRYLDALIMISIAVGVVDSASYLLALGHLSPRSSLGLSGVVCGIMGLAAYLMPRARIIALMPISVVPLSIPLWIISAWYIFWDIIFLYNTDMGTATTNFLAHVSGWVTGYCLGRWWFSDRKAEIQDELNHAIDSESFRLYMIHKPMSRHHRKQLEARDAFKYEKQQRNAFIDRLYHLNNSQKFEDTRSHLEEHASQFFRTDEEHDSLYQTIFYWKESRFRTWFAIQAISRHCRSNKLKAALRVCEDFREQLPKLTLNDTLHVIPLAKLALKTGKPDIAHALTCNISDRYKPGELDMAGADMLAALSFDEATGNTKGALRMARKLYSSIPPSREKEIRHLISELEKRQRKKQMLNQAAPN